MWVTSASKQQFPSKPDQTHLPSCPHHSLPLPSVRENQSSPPHSTPSAAITRHEIGHKVDPGGLKLFISTLCPPFHTYHFFPLWAKMKQIKGGHNGQEERNHHRWTALCHLWSGKAGTEKLTAVGLIIKEAVHPFISSLNKRSQSSTDIRCWECTSLPLPIQCLTSQTTGQGGQTSHRWLGHRDELQHRKGTGGSQLRPGVWESLPGEVRHKPSSPGRGEPKLTGSTPGLRGPGRDCQGYGSNWAPTVEVSGRHCVLALRNLNLTGKTGHAHVKR